MDLIGNRLYYCCVWNGGKVLYAYNNNGGDDDIEKLAALCLEKAPSHHKWYFQTMFGKSFGFLMEDGYVYFAIFDENILGAKKVEFLENVRDAFKKAAKKGSKRILSSSNPRLLQEQLLPVIRGLIASLEPVSNVNTVPSPYKGYTVSGQENKACLLRRSLYGLKQSPRQWYKRFDEFIVKNGFSRSLYDSCVYFKEYSRGNYVYLLLYVDDMLLACKDRDQIESTKNLLNQEFEMKDLGVAKKILGMEIRRNRALRQLKLTQEAYVKKILSNYAMDKSKPVTTPIAAHFKLSFDNSPKSEEERSYMERVPYANTVGSLMYLAVCSRPDLGYAVSLVSRFISNPGKLHWDAVKWILRYLRGTQSYGLNFGVNEDCAGKEVVGFSDSDYAKDIDKGRSITGYVFKVMGNVVSWKAQLQRLVALSSTEAEYIALTEAVKEVLWLKGFVAEMGLSTDNSVVFCDNLGAVLLSKNSRFHERTKHVNVRLHFIREVVESKEVKVESISTDLNPADVFTKALPGPKFMFCLKALGVG